MFTDWIHWFSSIRSDELLWALTPLLLLDAPRYVLGSLVMWACDFATDTWHWFTGAPDARPHDYCPSVCVVLAGLNEADTIASTLGSVWGSYPQMEIIVVDDGSTDGMADVANEFALTHANVLVIRKPRRGGKSSALNAALPFTQADVIVCVDTDSHLAPGAIWEIVQPMADPTVGAVSGTVIARNPYLKLITWLQAFEYLRSIFVGRMFAYRLDILAIVSGAFGAFRRDALQRVQGWDVGPGEDGDLVLRLRKAGYTIALAPYAQCLTNLPVSWKRLFFQRRRWEWATITFNCRKHVDLANPFAPHFRWSNLAMLVDSWLFSVVLLYAFWGYLAYLVWHGHEHLGKLLMLNYLAYAGIEVVNLLVVLYYSLDRRRDFCIGLVAPLMPFYYLFLKAAQVWAITEEILTRRSFRDNFVPEHVRAVTWHW
jgi:cellulose synthase/poly-beta-1,6-N-acetylglucosamine synthase-like glycosyltransferase